MRCSALREVFYKNRHGIRFFFSLLSYTTYFCVFFTAILVQLVRINLPWQTSTLLLINLSMVITARLFLFLLSVCKSSSEILEGRQHKNLMRDLPGRDNSRNAAVIALEGRAHTRKTSSILTRFKGIQAGKAAYSLEVLVTIVAVVVQARVIHSARYGFFAPVTSTLRPIHTKGAADLVCILTKLLIIAPILLYSHIKKLQAARETLVEFKRQGCSSSHCAVLSKEIKRQKILLYLCVTLIIVDTIALGGKIFNILEQTQHFYLARLINTANSGPDVFPLGPIIRATCMILTIAVCTAAYCIGRKSTEEQPPIEESEEVPRHIQILAPQPYLDHHVAREGIEPTTGRL